jgi:hypothetical protein
LFFIAAIACSDSGNARESPSTSPEPLTASPRTVDLLSSLSGYWTGTYDQPGVGEYPITLNFTSDSITVDYPSIPCAGTLTIDQSPSPSIVTYLTEHIETGKETCVDGGFVVLSMADGVLIFSWRKGRLTGVGRLTTADGPPLPVTPSVPLPTPE